MAAKTIAERLCQTKCMAARHILQDEAAMVGAQGVVSEDLEARLTQAEAKDLLSKEYTPMTYHGVQDVSSEHVEAKARCPKTADPLNKEYRPIRCAESESPQVERMRKISSLSSSSFRTLGVCDGLARGKLGTCTSPSSFVAFSSHRYRSVARRPFPAVQ